MGHCLWIYLWIALSFKFIEFSCSLVLKCRITTWPCILLAHFILFFMFFKNNTHFLEKHLFFCIFFVFELFLKVWTLYLNIVVIFNLKINFRLGMSNFWFFSWTFENLIANLILHHEWFPSFGISNKIPKSWCWLKSHRTNCIFWT